MVARNLNYSLMSFFWSNLNNDIRLLLPYGDIVFLPDINGDYLADDYECR